MIFKLKSQLCGRHVYDTVFAGPDNDHLANVGVLCMTIGEWQEFGAILLLGSKQTDGRVIVILEGDAEVIKSNEGM